ncbi:hypothetical protein K431DRAFT_95047 [Polychaeton citri CBS 116435]|uniref:Uncharacterized protein n=1 Tax=Polychaeton citri CBS 116435 TaxID=1314669 RepID=A0A9P4Q8D0_9PEZI|nr:hypothetical protein K431DRAFT_95047 [Polychaeton citri CBS 116435]
MKCSFHDGCRRPGGNGNDGACSMCAHPLPEIAGCPIRYCNFDTEATQSGTVPGPSGATVASAAKLLLSTAVWRERQAGISDDHGIWHQDHEKRSKADRRQKLEGNLQERGLRRQRITDVIILTLHASRGFRFHVYIQYLQQNVLFHALVERAVHRSSHYCARNPEWDQRVYRLCSKGCNGMFQSPALARHVCQEQGLRLLPSQSSEDSPHAHGRSEERRGEERSRGFVSLLPVALSFRGTQTTPAPLLFGNAKHMARRVLSPALVELQSMLWTRGAPTGTQRARGRSLATCVFVGCRYRAIRSAAAVAVAVGTAAGVGVGGGGSLCSSDNRPSPRPGKKKGLGTASYPPSLLVLVLVLVLGS